MTAPARTPIRWTARARRIGTWLAITAGLTAWFGPILYVTLHP